MNQCVIYTRVSTLVHQAQNGVSLEAQAAKLTAWAAANDYEVVGRHCDAGISGRSLKNRPGAQAAIAEACRRRCPLIIYSLSRLFRSAADCIRVSEQLRRHQADIISLSEALDGSTASGKLVLRLLGILAEFEADIVSERTLVAMGHIRSKQVRRISGTLPLGWDLGSDGRALIPNESEQRILDTIRRRRLEGASLQRIADELTAAQVPTKTGRSTQWRARTIMLILRRDQRLNSAA